MKLESLVGYVIAYKDECGITVYVKYDGLELSEVEVTGDLLDAIKFKTFEEAKTQLKYYVENELIDLKYVTNKKLWIEEVTMKSYVAEEFEF